MEEPIRRLLGLTKNRFEAVLSGTEPLRHGVEGTGPQAIAQALKSMNVDRELAAARAAINGTRKTARDDAVRKLGYLKAAQRLGIHPGDWMLSRVPVLPPAFRPVSVMSDSKLPLVSDANYLYKSLFAANENLAQLKDRVDDVGEERLAVYNAFKAVTGLGDPLQPQYKEKNIRGILKHVLGSSPKNGVVQRRLLSASMDLVGRGVISPNPDLDMDSIGIPEAGAWGAYRNFVVRRLTRRGTPLQEAVRMVEERSPVARQELLSEMETRPILANRAPVLHRFGIMAFKPRLVQGNTIQVSPLVVAPFGADFDGDSVVGDSRVTIEAPLGVAVRYGLCSPNCLIGGSEDTDDGDVLTTRQVVVNRQAAIICNIQIIDFPRLDKPLRVDEGGVEVYGVPEDIRVLTYDAVGERTYFAPVTEFSVHPNLAGVQLKFDDYGEVGLSNDHSVYCYDQDKGVLARRSPAASLGCYSPVVKRTVRPADDSAKQADPFMASIDLDFDFGWWLGATAVAGVSFWPRESRVSFGKRHAELFSRYCELTGKYSGSKLTGRSALSLGVEQLSLFVRRWLTPAGPDRSQCRLPAFTSMLPEACLHGVLTGLLDAGDDSRLVRWQGKKQRVAKHFWPIHTMSEGLCHDVEQICQRLGVRCHRTDHLNSNRCLIKSEEIRDSNNQLLARRYAISFSSTDFCRSLGSLPPFVDSRKSRSLEGFIVAERRQRDLIPADKPLLAEIQKYTLLNYKDNVNLYLTVRQILTTRPRLYRQAAKSLIASAERIGFASERFDVWKALVLDESVSWAKIAYVDDLPAQTMYDLTVPDTQVFAVNGGIVVYDTMQYHVPVSDEERREALERMLPSRNLISPQDFKSPLYAPRQEYLAGLYRATATKRKLAERPHRFASRKDVARAFARGDLSVDDVVEIDE